MAAEHDLESHNGVPYPTDSSSQRWHFAGAHGARDAESYRAKATRAPFAEGCPKSLMGVSEAFEDGGGEAAHAARTACDGATVAARAMR